MKQILTTIVTLLFSVAVFSQTGMFESNMVNKCMWDYEKEEYICEPDNYSTSWKMFVDPKSSKLMVLVVENQVVAAELITSSPKINNKTVHDGSQGTRVMYFKKKKLFLVYTNKDLDGRYREMYVFAGKFTKLSKKSFEKEVNKYEIAKPQGVVRQI